MAALLPLLALSFPMNPAQAAMPFVSPMFTDNMVLQRGIADPVWGWAAPGTNVTVTIGGKTATTTAGKDGKWLARVGPLPVGGPYTMEISGPQTAHFSNILVGDVWICSGQSNMEFGIANAINAADDIKSADYPNIRLYAVPKLIAASPVKVNAADWKVCTPDSVEHDGGWGGFSAVGYFFGRKLHQDLKVPIGLIHTSWGGTVAEAWTEEAALGKHLPEFRPLLNGLDSFRKQRDSHTIQERFAEWYQKNDAGMSAARPWSDQTLDDGDWKTMNVPEFFQKSGLPELNNQQSIVWMRKSFDLTADQAGKDLVLNFVADDNDVTFVNGTKVGATDGYNVPRAYKVPSSLLKAGKNVVAVRVTDTSAPGGIYGQPDSVRIDVPGETAISLSGAWRVKLGAVVNAKNPFPTTIEDNPNYTTVLYNGMIAPLAPYGIKGAIWYQGESNADRGFQYRTLLPTMITSWRDAFGQGKFPFLIVELAGFGQPKTQPGDDSWAELREAQQLTAWKFADAGIATAIDIGDANDIHPKNKQEVGRRLALVAEAKVYNQRVNYSGPVYKSVKPDGMTLRIKFDHTEGGLKTSDGGKLRGFSIAGDDQKWYWADAKIDGDTIVVSSNMLVSPVAVRYSWASFSDSNLVNGEGLPAFPFRTDNWKLTSEK